MTRPTVLKVGGSLLDWPGLPERLGQWLARPGATPCVILVGGGELVDLIREHDRTHRIGEVRAHDLAIRALDLTAHLLADLLPDARVIDRLDELPAVWSEPATPILAPRRWLAEHEDALATLPPCWDLTSDSIAARLADRLGASRLVLLKSAPCPAALDRKTASRLGLVDPLFPQAARGLARVVHVNLRDPGADLEGVPLTLAEPARSDAP